MTKFIKKWFCSFLFLISLLFILPTQIQAKTDLFFTPPQLQPNINQDINLQLKIDTTDPVIGMDLVINYDQSAVGFENISVGGFWNNPQILINRNESQNGKIYFSIFQYPARTGSDNLANLTFKTKDQKGSQINIDNATVIAGNAGQKLTAIFKGAVINPQSQTITSPTPITPSLVPTINAPTPTSLPPRENLVTVSASVNPATDSGQAGPTIILEETVTPTPTTNKTSTGFIIQVVALFLLIFGTLAFLTFKKNS